MSIPIYQKIENDIKEKILNKELNSGDLIPSENELKDIYDVSRMTVRQALNNLVNDGLLYRHKGKGTFVSNKKIEKNIHGVRGFTEEMLSMGKTVESKIKVFKVCEPDDKIKKSLFLEKGEKVYYVERIRYGNDIPVLYEKLYLPENMFPELTPEVMEQSFYDYIEKDQKLVISYCMQSIEAKLANTELADILETEKDSAILSIVRNTFLTNGRPFEYVISLYRADQYRFVQYAVKT